MIILAKARQHNRWHSFRSSYEVGDLSALFVTLSRSKKERKLGGLKM